jgi:hypothetical protein
MINVYGKPDLQGSEDLAYGLGGIASSYGLYWGAKIQVHNLQVLCGREMMVVRQEGLTSYGVREWGGYYVDQIEGRILSEVLP